MTRLFFLPGVGGSAEFWKPLGDRLPGNRNKTYFAWPGLGDNPPDPSVNGYDDLIAMVETQLGDEPVELLAQSMGGVIALELALRRPNHIRRLVLAVTSGGIDVSALGAIDWREAYRRDFPHVAEWVRTERPDVSARLEKVQQPSLLIWGDADPISPLAVGQHLCDTLPNASLMVVRDGQHDLIHSRPEDVIEAISAFLA